MNSQVVLEVRRLCWDRQAEQFCPFIDFGIAMAHGNDWMQALRA
jgi:hypothetical protein